MAPQRAPKLAGEALNGDQTVRSYLLSILPRPEATAPRKPYFRPSTPPDRDILTAAQLTAAFAPLARDYRAAILLSAGMGFRDRWRVLRLRLDAYDAALRLALDTAKADATVLLRGERARGGVR
jgi:hypothetical protein